VEWREARAAEEARKKEKCVRLVVDSGGFLYNVLYYRITASSEEPV